MTDAAFGDRMRQHLGVTKGSTLVSRTLRGAQTAITEIISEAPTGLSEVVAPEEAYMVAFQLRDYLGELWLNGSPHALPPLSANSVSLYDLRNQTQAYLGSDFHCLQFYIPRAGLQAIAEDHGGRLDDTPAAKLYDDVFDPVFHHLGQSLLPSLRNPDAASQIFTDYVALALNTHFATTYAGLRLDIPRASGLLARWQEARAKELLMADLKGETPLQVIAEACGLSASHFARAFRRTTGLPPHRWLMERRLEAAKRLLLTTSLPLADVAEASGYNDLSHFQRSFKSAVGVAPAAWRAEFGQRPLR